MDLYLKISRFIDMDIYINKKGYNYEEIYNKLVHDKIPKIIESDNKLCEIELVKGDKLHKRLTNKIIEKFKSFLIVILLKN